MTPSREQVLKWAREAGISILRSDTSLQMFAAIVIAAQIEKDARIAKNACLVPPDGGSPTPDEARMCDLIESLIRAQAPQPAPNPIGKEVADFEEQMARNAFAMPAQPAPRGPKLLSDDKIEDVWRDSELTRPRDCSNVESIRHFARAVERVVLERNTPQFKPGCY